MRALGTVSYEKNYRDANDMYVCDMPVCDLSKDNGVSNKVALNLKAQTISSFSSNINTSRCNKLIIICKDREHTYMTRKHS